MPSRRAAPSTAISAGSGSTAPHRAKPGPACPTAPSSSATPKPACFTAASSPPCSTRPAAWPCSSRSTATRAIATLDLRIDYQKPATPGLNIKAHSVCYRVTRSIAFVRATAYQDAEDDPVATATACFMIGANRTNMLTDVRLNDGAPPALEAPDDPAGPFGNSPFARFLGIRLGDGRHPGDAVLAKDHRQPDPARHPRRHDRRLPRNRQRSWA